MAPGKAVDLLRAELERYVRLVHGGAQNACLRRRQGKPGRGVVQACFGALPGRDGSRQTGLCFSDQEFGDPLVYASSVAFEKAAVGGFLSEYVPKLKRAGRGGRRL